MTSNQKQSVTLKVLSIVEATSINAVAKNMLEFHRSASDLKQRDPSEVSIETSLVTFNRSGSSTETPNEFVTAAREQGLGIDIIQERFRFDLRVIPALRKIVTRCQPDIVLTHQVKSHFLMKLSGLRQQYPWVAFHHGYTTTNRKMRAYNQLNRWSLPNADKVITVCEAFARELTVEGVPRERIHVQHNSIRPGKAVSTEDVEKLKTRLGIGAHESMLLTVGRLSREKAHIDLLAAFKRLGEFNPQIALRLVIVGDGTERDRLETAAESMGIRSRVVFTGEVSDVQPYYSAAQVFVLPSHSEGSPYVLLEAMAAEVPIVATAVGGVPEMVEDEESAMLVTARDSEAMTAAIGRVLTDRELARKLTKNASDLVTTRYSPETYVRSLVGIYREVISTSTKRNPQTT